MIHYVDLHPAGKIIIQIFMLIVMLKLLFLTISFAFSIRRKRLIISGIAAICLSAALLVLFMSEYKAFLLGTEPAYIAGSLLNIPVWIVILISVVLFAASVVADIQYSRYKKRFITISSIKEAIDNLEVGLCFSDENGTIRLANYKMNNLCTDIFRLNLQNANRLWERLEREEVAEGVVIVRTVEAPTVILPDETTWTFFRNFIDVDGVRYMQLIVIDTTELYKIKLEIENRNEKLKSINKSLRQYNETIEKLTRQEEIFETKVRVHDDMGKALLASKRFIEQDNHGIDYKELITMWQNNITLLHNEAKPREKSNEFERLEAAAKAIGVRLNVNGKIPSEDKKILHLLVSAARECLTNAVRHANADELTICIEELEGAYSIEYTNNGTPPVSTVKEGGGLSSLRNRIEQEAGSMKLVSEPRFMLCLTIPKEGRGYNV